METNSEQSTLRLSCYFLSGWLFLVPYLALYILYAAAKWPIQSPQPGVIVSFSSSIPPLLLLFRVLHATHAFLAGFTAWSLVRKCPRGRLWPNLRRIVPWMLLFLLLFIPGAYLEFPADTWEHYARINRWKEVLVTGSDMGGYGWYYKVSYYFFAYSLIGVFSPYHQLVALAFLQSSIGMLLCWQLYRLALICRLSPTSAFIFVLCQFLATGNDLFNFYRYYGFSSTPFALIGAFGATRVTLQLVLNTPASPLERILPLSPIATRFFGIVALVTFSGLHHLQGLCIAALAIGAVLGWRFFSTSEASTRIAVFLSLFTCCVAAVILWPRHPLIDSHFRKDGWLNAWYGFDIFSADSPAQRRALLIFGAIGVLNLVAGLWLFKKKHVVGWLTVFPALVLQLPVVSIPIANALAPMSSNAVVVFHRLFFAVPTTMALVLAGEKLASYSQASGQPWRTRLPAHWSFCVVLGCLTSLVLLPPSYPYCNRLWNSLWVPPNDLTFRKPMSVFYQSESYTSVGNFSTTIVASAGLSFAVQSYAPISSFFESDERLYSSRPFRCPTTDYFRIESRLPRLAETASRLAVRPSPMQLFSPLSTAGLLTRHWNPVEVALAYTSYPFPQTVSSPVAGAQPGESPPNGP